MKDMIKTTEHTLDRIIEMVEEQTIDKTKQACMQAILNIPLSRSWNKCNQYVAIQALDNCNVKEKL